MDYQALQYLLLSQYHLLVQCLLLVEAEHLLLEAEHLLLEAEHLMEAEHLLLEAELLKSWTITTSRRYRYHGFLRSGHTIVLPDHTLGSISHPFGPFQPLSSSRGNQQDSPSDTHV